jgi:hypothetical protein
VSEYDVHSLDIKVWFWYNFGLKGYLIWVIYFNLTKRG